MLFFGKYRSFSKESRLIASTHLAAGAAMGVLSYRFLFKINSVFGLAGALVLGVVSHLVLDVIPHGDDEFYRPGGSDYFLPLILSVEVLFSFLAVYWCGIGRSNWHYQNGYLLAGMVGGALPDVPRVFMASLQVDWKFLQVADQVNLFFHTSLHVGSFWHGLLLQVVISIFSLFVLYYFKQSLLKAAS